jgi:hypothetical protein
VKCDVSAFRSLRSCRFQQPSVPVYVNREFRRQDCLRRLTSHGSGLLLFDLTQMFIFVWLAGALKAWVSRPSP